MSVKRWNKVCEEALCFMEIELIPEITADGSLTLYRADIDEHYHSTFGAETESRHVYVDCGLRHRAGSRASNEVLRVFEVGFGTGANAVLSAMTGIPLEYTTIEKYPLDEAVVERVTALSPDVGLSKCIHCAPWNRPTVITPTFKIHKIQGDLTEFLPTELFDVIYMDAFAPEKQPEMWTASVLAKLAGMLAPGGVLTTYCAKGRIRRAFEQNGLVAERLAGPPGGKREILRLTKPLM